MTQVNQTNLSTDTETTPRCSESQIQVWLRSLLTLAWADGDFDETEQQLVANLTHHAVTNDERSHVFEPVTGPMLQEAFGNDPELAEDFLRTAVMVAIADGVYTAAEDALLAEFCEALDTGTEVLASLRLTLVDRDASEPQAAESMVDQAGLQAAAPHSDPLHPVRNWLDGMQVQDPKVAHFLCRLIPAQCPFERDVTLFGKKVVHIPPMCKLNPLYEQMVGLRFRALSYLADDCGEDVSPFI